MPKKLIIKHKIIFEKIEVNSGKKRNKMILTG